jgi:hypothetical protein
MSLLSIILPIEKFPMWTLPNALPKKGKALVQGTPSIF